MLLLAILYIQLKNPPEVLLFIQMVFCFFSFYKKMGEIKVARHIILIYSTLFQFFTIIFTICIIRINFSKIARQS